METTRGQLLVATPLIDSGPFFRSVVLMLDHDEDGALGVIINRPLDAALAEVFPDLTDLAAVPDCLFHGGPVAADSALALAVLAGDSEPVGWRTMTGKVGLIDLDVPAEMIAHAIRGLRVFAGYAGWSSGQLEDELDKGTWLVVPSRPDDLMSDHPDRLWHEVLARQPGDERLMANFPENPNLN